jgi:sodium transport system permease protein
MRALWTILRKELLDAFRDRRMVLVAFVVMPLAIPLVLAGTNALSARKQAQQLEGSLRLPIVGAQHAPNLVTWLGTHNVEVLAPPADVDAAVRRQEYEVVLRIGEQYGADWRAGRVSLLEREDARRQVQTARITQISQQLALSRQWIALYKAMGGGWQRPTTSSNKG